MGDPVRPRRYQHAQQAWHFIGAKAVGIGSDRRFRKGSCEAYKLGRPVAFE